jgi:AraC-like DNA-binding protein
LYSNLEKGHEFLQHAPCGAALSEAAAASGLSEFHFCRLFKETYGETPAKFHRSALLDRAKCLLPQMSVSEVAEELGYNSVSAFVRAFRVGVGVTPGCYKKAPSD